ncbi:hypothetical protein SCALM49S_05640 [Streptomyces californicus]
MPRTVSAVTACVASSRTRQAKSVVSVRAAVIAVNWARRRRVRSREASGVTALRQVDADPQRVLAERTQREGAGVGPGGEEPGERGPVQQRDPVRESGGGVAGAARLAGPGLQLTEHRVLPGGFESGAESGDGLRGAVEEFAQFRYGGEVAVGGPGRGRAAGRGRWRRGGCPGCRHRRRALREDGGCLVGVGGAAVEVEVVGGGGVADAYDDVEGVVRAEGCARAADGEYGRLSGQGAQPEGLDDGPHQPGGLARAGRSDGQQRGAEEGGVRAIPVERRA